ncbi:MAG TPA: acyl-ACP thioesterase domain-containing protein [Anaerolineaceae bacterium]|nr:acyl-ACP thioesterase domain-containing protein [Anaerolineaceae bacterium]
MEPVWNEEILIKFTDGDYYRRWRLAGLFQAMQESAARHALHLGVGYDQLILQDLAWVLARFKVRLHSLPLAGERVKLRTWPKGIQQKLFFMRDFLLLDEAGQMVYAEASSAWLVINTRMRRMQLPTVLGEDLPDNGGKNALAGPLERIETRGELEEQFTVQARTSMIDLMGHVTSARYLEWICDCFPVEAFRGSGEGDGLAWLQVNFNREVRPGERVAMSCGREGEVWHVQGTNLDSGANAFDAELGFRTQV